MSVFVLLEFLHVLLAIIAIGFNASYPIWIARARREPEHALYALKGIKTLGDRFANPAYALLLALGLSLTFTGGYSLGTPWISAALVLYVLLVVGHPAGDHRRPDGGQAGVLSGSDNKPISRRPAAEMWRPRRLIQTISRCSAGWMAIAHTSGRPARLIAGARVTPLPAATRVSSAC
jgi:hypothetical protein